MPRGCWAGVAGPEPFVQLCGRVMNMSEDDFLPPCRVTREVFALTA